MKYIQLIAFFFYLVLSAVGGGNQALHANDLSARLKLSFMEGRCAMELKKDPRYNWGVSLNTGQLFPVIPVVFKTGNISCGGIISRLNSPELSSVLSTSAAQVKPYFLEASLPASNSFTKPVSWFMQGGYYSKKTPLKSARISVFADKSLFTCSFDCKAVFKKSITTTLCLTGGFYPYKQTEVSSWFNNACFYHPGSHVCTGAQFSVSSKKAGTLWIINAYESPGGTFAPVFRTENYFKHNNLSFILNGFYNQNENVITSSGKNLVPQLQIKTAVNYQFINGIKTPVIIKYGLSTQADIKLNADIHNLRTAAGIKFTGQKNTVNIGAKALFNIKKMNEGAAFVFSNGNIDLSYETYFKNLKPQVTAKFSFENDDKKEKWTFTQKAGLNLYYYGKVEFSNKNSIVFTKNKMNFSSSLGAKVLIKDLSFKLNVEVEI